MSTVRQIEANRANAQHSTGPVTPQGKAVVAQNATRHGLAAKQVVLPDEDPAEFEAFRDGLRGEWRPVGPSETHAVDCLIADNWRMERIFRLETDWMRLGMAQAVAAEPWRNPNLTPEQAASLTARGIEPKDNNTTPVTLVEGVHTMFVDGTFDRLRRYELQIERRITRTTSELQALQAARAEQTQFEAYAARARAKQTQSAAQHGSRAEQSQSDGCHGLRSDSSCVALAKREGGHPAQAIASTQPPHSPPALAPT